MIYSKSRSLAWVKTVADKFGVKDIALVEKTIRAFSLLESLVRSECPLIFKGGTSIMLHFDNVKRLSIDIDIICPPGTQIEEYLWEHYLEYGFEGIEMEGRISRTAVPKNHAKFFYQVVYPTNGRQDKILLDVLFEEEQYANVIDLPISCGFLKQVGEPMMVKSPSAEDLLGDKLTAFAPHTTGIPFFKGEKDCTSDINKQLFDIGFLFDAVNDLDVTAQTFNRIAKLELKYKGLNPTDIKSVLDDIFNTALCFTLRGQVNPEEFTILQCGISRINGFMLQNPYTLDNAIVNAAKAAYLSKLIETGIREVHHYVPLTTHIPEDAHLSSPLPTKLNKLRRSNKEAFFYWNEIQKLMWKSSERAE